MIEQQSSRASFTFGASESITANLSFSNNMNANEFYEWITFSRASLVEYISNSPSSSSHSFSSFFFLVDNFTACECFLFYISGVWYRNNRLVHRAMYYTNWSSPIILQIPTLEGFEPWIMRACECYYVPMTCFRGQKRKKIEDHILTPTTCRSLPFKIIIKNTVGTVDIIRYLLPLTQYHSF